MNPDPHAQLRAYVRSLFDQHINEQAIRTNLLNAGWDSAAVDAAINQERPSPHRVRNGVLWIVSPLIVFVCAGIMSAVLAAAHIHSAFANIIIVLLGLAGGLLVIIGPIVGVVILSRR